MCSLQLSALIDLGRTRSSVGYVESLMPLQEAQRASDLGTRRPFERRLTIRRKIR